MKGLGRKVNGSKTKCNKTLITSLVCSCPFDGSNKEKRVFARFAEESKYLTKD